MKVLERGVMPNGTNIQIEEWNESYSFMPYGSTIASYPLSKASHDDPFAPKEGTAYRFSFEFESGDEASKAFSDLLSEVKTLADFKDNLSDKKYSDCI